MSGPALSRARTAVGRTRNAMLVVSLAGALYLTWRIDFLRLPSAGCSPVLRFAPGVMLVIDGHPPRLFEGDVVLFADGPTLLLGIVERFGERDATSAEAPLWITTDDVACDARSSEQLGWIPAHALRGRVLFALPL